MSVLLHTSIYDWIDSTNTAFVAFRAHVDQKQPKPSNFELLKGAASNALKAVGYSFASIPQLVIRPDNRTVSNWTQAKMYWALTMICLKAMWKFDQALEPLREVEAQVYLNGLLNLDLKNAPVQVRINRADYLKDRLEQIFPKLPLNAQENILNDLCKKFNHNLDEFNQLRVLTFVFNMCVTLKMSHQTQAEKAFETLVTESAKKDHVLLITVNHQLSFIPSSLVKHVDGTVFAPHAKFPSLQGLRVFKDGYGSEFFNKLQTVIERPVDLDQYQHDALWADTAFLVQMAACANDSQIKTFLEKACRYWGQRIAQGEEVSKEHEDNLFKLMSKFNHGYLKTALQLHVLSKFQVNQLNEEWHKSLNGNMRRILGVLFAQATKLPLLPLFMRLLSLQLTQQQQNLESINAMLAYVKSNMERFKNAPAELLKDAQEELTGIWNKFPQARNLPLCLQLYTHLAPTGLFPMFDSIPELALRIAKEETPPPEECGLILIQSLDHIKGTKEEKCARYFELFSVGQERRMIRLKMESMVCLMMTSLSLLTEEQAKQVVANLKDYIAPDSAKTKPELILKEGVELFKLAKKYPSQAAAIIAYLKSNKVYGEMETKLSLVQGDASSDKYGLYQLYK